MLAPRHIIFTALQGALVDSGTQSWAAASEALAEVARHRVPLVISTTETRAQIEPLRRKIEHSHPFITESGGGLFLPDGYFSLALEGAARVARYFCVPFGQPYAATSEALAEIAAAARAGVVGYSQMSARELAQNTSKSLREAELSRDREFSERFFFAGEVPAAATRFAEAARQRGWNAIPGEPFWELRSGNDQGRAVRYLMQLYRKSMRSRLSSVGIGSAVADLPLLLAVDHPVILPDSQGRLRPELIARLRNAVCGSLPGAAGWNEEILRVLEGRFVKASERQLRKN
jgi:mannosyl-3-phosphoglycerate phosphatase